MPSAVRYPWLVKPKKNTNNYIIYILRLQVKEYTEIVLF